MRDIALVGLAGSGKSTVFTAVSGQNASRDARAVVEVPDERVERLSDLFRSKKTTYARLNLIDVAGLDPHSLGSARAADALAIVLRAFGPDVDLARDLDSFCSELALTDLQTMEKVRERAAKQAKGGDAARKLELAVAERAEAALGEGIWLSEVEWTAEERQTISLWTPLTFKPQIHVINGDDAGEAAVPSPSVTILGDVEAEATELDVAEGAELLAGYGITEPARHRFVRAAYEALGLITFYTGNAEEARAWDLPRGAKAPKAAGAIHSDFEKGFIRAERVHYEDVISAGSFEAAREKGLVRVEGKDYVISDGDYLSILHS